MVSSLPGRGVPAKPGWVGVNTCAGTASASWSAHPVTVWGPPPPCMTRMGWPSPRSDTVTSISPIPSTDRVWVLVSMITPCALELANTDGEQRRDGLLDAPGKQQSSDGRGGCDEHADKDRGADMPGPGVAGSGGQARREDAPDDGGAERAAQLAQNVVGRPGQACQFGGDGLDRDRGAGRDDRAAAGADNDEAPGEVAQTGSAVDAEQRDKANDGDEQARGQDDPRTDSGLQAPGEQAGRGVAGEHAAQSFGDAQVRDVLVREDQALYEHHADDGEQHPHGRESGSAEVTRGEQLRAE